MHGGSAAQEGGTLVRQTPSTSVCARFEDFVRGHSDAILDVLRGSTHAAVCISLACVEDRDGVTTWTCLFGHDGTDSGRIEDSIRAYLQSPNVRTSLKPLDLTAEKFHYAIISGLCFGTHVRPNGRVFFRRERDGQGYSSPTAGALFSSGDLTAADNIVTVGCLVKTRKANDDLQVFGVTLAVVSDDLLERKTRDEHLVPTSTTNRGDGEICVLATNPPPAKASDIVSGDCYGEGGSATAKSLSLCILDMTASDTRTSAPWCLLLFDETTLRPTMDAVGLEQGVKAAPREPRADSELMVLSCSAIQPQPRCLVSKPYAWMKSPGSTHLFPVRKLQFLPKYHLAPEDIGALVVEEVDGVFMAHYQIVALGTPDEAFAVSITDLLGLLSRSGYTDTTILGTGNMRVVPKCSQLEVPPASMTQLVLRSQSAERTDADPSQKLEIPLESFRTVLGKASPHSPTRDLAAIKAFNTAVRRFTLNNYLKDNFVLIEYLDQWAQGKATDPSRPNNTWIVLLLVDAHRYYGGIENYPTLTTIRNDIKLSADKSIFRLFCILLQIGAGHLIEPLSYFICDDDLPLAYQNLESQLLSRRIASSTEEALDIARKFVQAQYAFCCRPLVKRKVTKFNPYEVVPITRMEPVNDREQVANVYHIEIPSDYVSPAIQKLVSDEHRFELDGIAFYEFAVKSFNDAKDFHDELSNFVLAQDIPSVVQWFSQYEVYPAAHDRRCCQYNLVLELGRLDLNQLIQSTKSPVLFRDVLEVWSSLGTVIDALCELHSRIAPTETEGIMIQGWHADLKPENILRAGNTWKLTDLGHARSKLNFGKALTEKDYVGGTVTYGAPETFTRNTPESNITPRIDIWSLGAVFSAVATWVILGAPGVAHYKRVRQSAIHSLLTGGSNNYALYIGDYFHNGLEVLPEVTAWHDFLRYSLRKSDPLTGKILDIVDHFMLKGDPRRRYSAAEINLEYKRCLAEARNADHEPRGTLWSQHRNIIALAEQEVSDDDFVTSQFNNALAVSRRSPQSTPSSPLQYPRNLMLPMTQPENLTLRPLSRGLEKVSTSTEEGVMDPIAPRPSSSVRFKSPQEGAIEQRFDISWARKSLRLDEKRFRSPTRSLLRSAAKKVGMKQKSERASDRHLASFYKDRHLVFLVDNGPSMSDHWREATTLLETLAAMIKGVRDVRCVDLRFTYQKHHNITQERNVRQFMRAMDAAQPKPGPQAAKTNELLQPPGFEKTDMAAILSELLAEYKIKIRRAKGFTIIVLTDGKWATVSPGVVQEEISRFASQYGRPFPRHRPFNIEFVWFGDSDGPPKKLTDLDGQTKDSRNLGPVVNTENSNGSVYSMLLGSFTEGSDSEKRDALRTPFPKEDEPFDPDSD